MALTFSVPDTELSLTLHNRRAEVVDNIFTGTPYLNAMREHGGVINEHGGLEIVQPLLMSKNTTAGSFSGFDVLDTTPQANETSAVYPWRMLYATIAISVEEEAKNEGKGRLINLVNQKIDDATMSLRDTLNSQCMAAQPAAGSKDLASTTEIMDNAPSADPPRTSSIGSIGNANTWWRNQATSGGSFTVADMNAVWNDVSDGIDFPNFLITNSTVYEYYENSQVGLIRYGDTRMADAGFDALLYKSKPIFWDAGMFSTGAIFYVNTKYFRLSIHPSLDFKTTDFIEPDNQAAKVAKIIFMGNQTCSNRRRVGTLSNITAPA